MAIGYESDPKTLSITASGDLSTKQYYLVKINSSDQLAVCTSRGERAFGVLMDDPSANTQAGRVCYLGACPVEAGGTFNAGDPLTTNASGKAIKAELAGDVVVGTAVEDGANGERTTIAVGSCGSVRGDGQMIIVEDFENNYDAVDLPSAAQVDGTAASGTADETNVLHLKSSNWGYAAMGTQTITVPVTKTDAVNSLVCLDIGMDQTDNDGVNIWTHFWPASGRPFVIGSDAAFYALLKFSIQDVSGTDDFHFGFRRASVQNATYDNLLDAADLMVTGTTVNTSTILNNGATSETDTTDAIADAARTYTFKVLVSAAGVVTFQHDIATEGTLAAPTAAGAFTFDDGDPVIPFIYFLHAGDVAGEVAIYKYEVGYQ